MKDFESLKKSGDIPEFMTADGYKTLQGGYLQKDETPKEMYKRLAVTAAKILKRPELEQKFFNLFWNNWLCPASPVASNFGTNRGLPISCYASHTEDRIIEIFQGYTEVAMLTKNGGGIGRFWGDVTSDPIPWLKIEQDTLEAVSQSGVRRGAGASYINIENQWIEDFISIRRPTGDQARRCLSINFHHGVSISDEFMQSAKSGNKKNRDLWELLLRTRHEVGEPYLLFRDNANRGAPDVYKKQGLKISTSNLCNEIMLHTDKDHTFVCCLSSMNLVKFDEWKNTDAVQLSILFLDAVMTEFIDKAQFISGLEKAVNFAKKSRALGLGVLGWHSLLQAKLIPFESFEAMSLNAEIFRHLDSESRIATERMAKELGEPEWCKGFGVRNSHRLAVAPTVSNSLISGGHSQGIEPIAANAFAQISAKGVFVRKNLQLEALLESRGKNTHDIWNSIINGDGSVAHLDFLSTEEKDVFKTAREINQFAIVRQAGQRQKWIDQGQSVNLFFAAPADIRDDETKKKLGRYIHEVHWEAWELGLKGLYYLRPDSAIKGDAIYRQAEDCVACSG